MAWEPTTRGTGDTRHVCHYGTCRLTNTELNMYVVDNHGVRYFCQEHWKWACLLFGIVKKCDKCRRNHSAELYEDARTLDSVKYGGKWWDLCHRHTNIFIREMCLFTGLDLGLRGDD
jgi:hypothetical protein